jgi:ubiquinone/menaquinone biosynthesis C-methylase UbiE
VGINDMDTHKNSEKFWDRMANQFDKQTSHFEKPPVEKAVRYLTLTNNVLDYGCATGSIAIEIADYVKEIKGIDISSGMIEAAVRKANELKIG